MRATHLRGARTNNLRDVDLDLEPGTLVVVAGPSGSGKSSLAFGTLYAEGQRRYVESFSAYARQFLERLARPPVNELDPVAAAVAVDRQSPVKTSRSTVGTLTELTDYAKDLWAGAATLQCPGCGDEVHADSPASAAEHVLKQAPDRKIVVTYPIPIRDAEHFVGVREGLAASGYRRLWVGDATRDIDEVRPSDVMDARAQGKPRPYSKGVRGKKKRTAVSEVPAAGRFDVIADRLVSRANARRRLTEALEAAFERGAGHAHVLIPDGERLRFSNRLHCARCEQEFRRATPGLFSYNSALGACPTCRGFGRVIEIDWAKVVPDPSKTLAKGAIRPWNGKATQWERRELFRRCKKQGIPTDVPFEALTEAQRSYVIDGDGVAWPQGWPGVRGWFEWLQTRAYKMHVRVLLARYRKYVRCDDCDGRRLKPEALWWKIDGVSIADFYALSVERAHGFIRGLERSRRNDAVDVLAREIGMRLSTLLDVGLGYLTLARDARSLSGGELQRVSLTSGVGASLTGAMFVLDEPTVGLHPADVRRLGDVVQRLKDGGNLVLVVEHDAAMIQRADRVIELGPDAGEHGGKVVFDGTPAQLRKASTRTGRMLRRSSPARRVRREPNGWLQLSGCNGHNLRDVDVEIPRGVLTCVTGVSGSGKSTLILETLYPAVARHLGQRTLFPLEHAALEGCEDFRSAVRVDQAPLGRTSRGNPATYLGAWDVVRKRFAETELARTRGYKPGVFSFNVPGGRCEACRGEGAETVEMQFLADVTFSCPECAGRRFVGPVLDVEVAGTSIADVLEMTADAAREHFHDDAVLRDKLQPLIDVGLGYLRLGQPLSTLSGGEAQRLKLAEAVGRASADGLLVLDEPTAGLHFDDIEPLLTCLDALVERGNTVVVVEHDMQVAAHADHVIDLGPGAGDAGGRLVASGTPEHVAGANTTTGSFLAAALKGSTMPARLPAPERKRGRVKEPSIDVVGAREHNLRNLDVSLPRERLIVVTGPSGSGKSTLAFDIVYAEGQRRFLETLSPYARQYLPQLPRPAVDRVVGVPPSVSLEQRTTAGATNSTVATITETAHYLRLLFARAGTLFCPECDEPIAPRQPAMLAEDVRRRFGKRKVALLAPVVRGRKGFHRDVLTRAMDDGITEARIDGQWRTLQPGMALERFKEHDIDLVVSRTSASDPVLSEHIQEAARMGRGTVRVVAGAREALLSTARACPSCGRGFPELDPRFFSFNTRQGACPRCEGRGVIERRRGRGKAATVDRKTCPECQGTRLSGLALHVRLGGAWIAELLALTVVEAIPRIQALELAGREAELARIPLYELLVRLRFLDEVGLGYLSLDRAAWTLSGGEMQRVRLAAQLGSGLTGLLYVLDEPTIGLHPRDTGRLLRALRKLVDKGCSVLVVEHDADTIRAADHLLDIGPGGGQRGGRILAQGPSERVLRSRDSVTARSLQQPPPLPERRRGTHDASWLKLRGAQEHNLKKVDLDVPLGRLVCVTGVSGSGKSTLVRDVLLPATRKALGLQTPPPGRHRKLDGAQTLRRAVEIDQSPIGRTPRSVPATYVGVWSEIRRLLAGTPEARARGYDASRFSFNVAKGRCDVCDGQGATSVEMSFLPQVLLPCEACGGMRFDAETLQVRLHGCNAGELLAMHVDEAVDVLSAVPKVAEPLRLLEELGLGYLTLGQASNTLSGGEAQRLKLVAELGNVARGGSLYVMDEPTTGLHRGDVERLLNVLHRLVDRGDTVVVIEHHPDVLLAADWLVDLGPEAGAEGGTLVASGTPEEVMRVPASHTGAALRYELEQERRSAPPATRKRTAGQRLQISSSPSV